MFKKNKLLFCCAGLCSFNILASHASEDTVSYWKWNGRFIVDRISQSEMMSDKQTIEELKKECKTLKGGAMTVYQELLDHSIGNENFENIAWEIYKELISEDISPNNTHKLNKDD